MQLHLDAIARHNFHHIQHLRDQRRGPPVIETFVKVGTTLVKLADDFSSGLLKNLDDLASYGLKNVDDLVSIGIRNLNDLSSIGIKNVEDLATFGIKNVDDLTAVGIKNVGDLTSLGVKNIDDLAKIGIKSVDDLAAVGITKLDDLTALGLKNVDDLAALGVTKLDDLRALGVTKLDDLMSFGVKAGDDFESLLKGADQIANASKAAEGFEDAARTTAKADPKTLKQRALDAAGKITTLGVAGVAVAAVFIAKAIQRYKDTDNKMCNITAITKDKDTGKTRVTFSPSVDLDTSCTVDITGSDSVPSIDGEYQKIVSVISQTVIILDHVLTKEGTNGLLKTHSTFEGALAKELNNAAKTAGGIAGSGVKAVAEAAGTGVKAFFDGLGLGDVWSKITAFFDQWKWVCSASCVCSLLVIGLLVVMQFMKQ